eukprot:TRINITY_DN107904_c0_g1_i1.p1 TRINITY_DN107904_c0_g1~~TRINITY_DN107904_c0_g1_i1.p1  ORF type:complete len:100 (+),score=12.23 TRINITY_DN107904_c0_g1_i1:2-301(+)
MPFPCLTALAPAPFHWPLYLAPPSTSTVSDSYSSAASASLDIVGTVDSGSISSAVQLTAPAESKASLAASTFWQPHILLMGSKKPAIFEVEGLDQKRSK